MQMRIRTARFLSILALAGAVIVSGCGQTIKTDKGSVSVKNGQVEVKTDEGSVTTVVPDGGGATASVALPKGWRSDLLPVMDGIQILAVSTDQDRNFGVIFKSQKSSKEIQDFYLKALEGAAQFSQAQGSAGDGMMTGTKDGYLLTVIVNPAEGGASGALSMNRQ